MGRALGSGPPIGGEVIDRGDGGIDEYRIGMELAEEAGVVGLRGPREVFTLGGIEPIAGIAVTAVGGHRVGHGVIEHGKMEKDNTVARARKPREGVEIHASTGEGAAVEIVAHSLTDGVVAMHKGIAAGPLRHGSSAQQQ